MAFRLIFIVAKFLKYFVDTLVYLLLIVRSYVLSARRMVTEPPAFAVDIAVFSPGVFDTVITVPMTLVRGGPMPGEYDAAER